MKAIVRETYGSPDVLHLEDVPMPIPGDGDVLVWGGPSRLVYHAVRPIKPGTHPVTGGFRYNLTFRHAR